MGYFILNFWEITLSRDTLSRIYGAINFPTKRMNGQSLIKNGKCLTNRRHFLDNFREERQHIFQNSKIALPKKYSLIKYELRLSATWQVLISTHTEGLKKLRFELKWSHITVIATKLTYWWFIYYFSKQHSIWIWTERVKWTPKL